MEMIYLCKRYISIIKIDLINPCWGNVFKAIFTKDTPEPHGALEYLLSAIIKHCLTGTPTSLLLKYVII